jgi:hypothetical protein
MRILICGDREFRDAKRIYAYLTMIPTTDTIIQGDARGADTITWVCCELLGLPWESFPADWEKYGKAAGPIRNKEMLDSKPDLVVYFHNNITRSKGTLNMINMARQAGVKVIEGFPE